MSIQVSHLNIYLGRLCIPRIIFFSGITHPVKDPLRCWSEGRGGGGNGGGAVGTQASSSGMNKCRE